jgi:hypothetical protein
VKKPAAFYKTRLFVTAFTKDCHWTPFWASWIKSITLSTTSRPALRPTQPTSVGTRGSFTGVKRRGVSQTTDHHLVPRLRTGGDIPQLTISRCVYGVCRENFFLIYVRLRLLQIFWPKSSKHLLCLPHVLMLLIYLIISCWKADLPSTKLLFLIQFSHPSVLRISVFASALCSQVPSPDVLPLGWKTKEKNVTDCI